MIIPVRCFGCGKPIGHLWEEFKKKSEAGEDKAKLLDEMKIERYCCRAAFLGQSDILTEIAKFKKS
ncbi:DNA-directed RNA polymerase subunit N [Candidatus Pacearchaeota archaeon]|nr:DNA-directed RNA polymerase subunit N [Candidatus Pacearchaeota archaeon]